MKTQKVVINKTHGGFSLSPKGMVEYYKLKGQRLWVYECLVDTEYIHINGQEVRSVVKIKLNPIKKVDGPLRPSSRYEYSLKPAKNDQLDEEYTVNDYQFDRTDPDLIKVVESLKDLVNGQYADLRVVEIPLGIKWVIQEQDGREWIAEEHRTWE